MNTAVMFSKATDEWATPRDFFQALHREFDFVLDVAATMDNRTVPNYLGHDHPFGVCNALAIPWAQVVDGGACWMNPPYSKCREFIAKAAEEAHNGCTVVCLVPARTDTRWFHQYIYNAETDAFRPGVEVRFVKGRLKFGGSTNSAPFPSMVVIFRPLR